MKTIAYVETIYGKAALKTNGAEMVVEHTKDHYATFTDKKKFFEYLNSVRTLEAA